MPYKQRQKRRFFSTVFKQNRLILKPLRGWGCYQSQNYKIWKQFTTQLKIITYENTLLSIAKLQNLKAIHNVSNRLHSAKNVVINRKTTKFESNSQLWCHNYSCVISCYQSQNYKIWKQFTTSASILSLFWKLLSIAKLQNLKAIHNRFCLLYMFCLVVINRKTTKFESNSQQGLSSCNIRRCCYQSQNYKIWKQFTTMELLQIKK